MDEEFLRGKKEAVAFQNQRRAEAEAGVINFQKAIRALYDRLCNSLGKSKKFRIALPPSPGFSPGAIYIFKLGRGKENWLGFRSTGYQPAYRVCVRHDDVYTIFNFGLYYAETYEGDSIILSAQTADEFMRKMGELFGDSL